MGGDIADTNTNPPIRAAVRAGRMRCMSVMQRHTARRYGHRHAVFLFKPAKDSFATADEMVRLRIFNMRQKTLLVRAGHHSHATRADCRVGQRDPCSDLFSR